MAGTAADKKETERSVNNYHQKKEKQIKHYNTFSPLAGLIGAATVFSCNELISATAAPVIKIFRSLIALMLMRQRFTALARVYLSR
jgi:hypothetical protein